MGLNRWRPFLSVVFLLLVLASVARVWPAPLPQISCDPNDISQSQLAEASALGGWAHTRLVHLSTVAGLFVVALFYFQLFHWSASQWSTALIGLTATFAGLGAAFESIRGVQRWASEQSPSCLQEALLDPFVALQASWSGRLLREVAPSTFDLPSWTSLLMVDAAMLAVVAFAIGWAAYLAARKTLSL